MGYSKELIVGHVKTAKEKRELTLTREGERARENKGNKRCVPLVVEQTHESIDSLMMPVDGGSLSPSVRGSTLSRPSDRRKLRKQFIV